MHNLRLLHCFRELAAILLYAIMLKLLLSVSSLGKLQNVILLLVSLQNYLILAVMGYELTIATSRHAAILTSWRLIYLVVQQDDFSIGWLYVFYKCYSDGKIHMKKIH